MDALEAIKRLIRKAVRRNRRDPQQAAVRDGLMMGVYEIAEMESISIPTVKDIEDAELAAFEREEENQK